jgi:carbamoyltransferase
MGYRHSNTEIVEYIQQNKLCGVARGPAEFGPRALGNRSLLADPRDADIKDRVNEIKQRQQFRPFAPAILEELVDEYFDMPHGWNNSRYMQVVAHCRHPELYPAIVHRDGTSRVQTVPKDDSPFRQLLEQWYAATGCPMLLNTSLNIKGKPMVNNHADARNFERQYKVRVFN